VEEEAPVYYKEETNDDDDIDPSLLDDYVLLDLEHRVTVFSDSPELVEVPAITLVSSSSSPLPSSLVEVRGGYSNFPQ